MNISLLFLYTRFMQWLSHKEPPHCCTIHLSALTDRKESKAMHDFKRDVKQFGTSGLKIETYQQRIDKFRLAEKDFNKKAVYSGCGKKREK